MPGYSGLGWAVRPYWRARSASFLGKVHFYGAHLAQPIEVVDGWEA